MLGTAQLATELIVSPEEFEKYHIASVPTSIAFQLKEFTVSVVPVHSTYGFHQSGQQATVAYADSMSLATLMRFTEPGRPIIIILETDDTESLFAISTTFDSIKIFPTPQSRRSTASATPQRTSLKRVREEDSAELRPTPGSSGSTSSAVPHSARRKPLKVVQRQDVATAHKLSPVAHSVANSQSVRDSRSMPPPSSIPHRSSPTVPPSPVKQEEEGWILQQEEPLFLPSSQLTQQDIEIIKNETANMTEEELAEILQFDDDELEEFDNKNKDEGMEDVSEIAATQSDHSSGKVSFQFCSPTQPFNNYQTFRPLFED